MRTLVVFGTRPEAIKMAPIVQRLQATEQIESRVCVTAQHRQMLDQALDLFQIQPDYDLGLMKPGQSLTDLTSAILAGMRPVFEDFKPDRILVHGDTTTTFAATLAAYYHRVSVGHVEAGLRTGNLFAPWPEEANRQLTTVLADMHFAPTEGARQNLLNEGVAREQIYLTGNTVIDALNEVVGRIREGELSLAEFGFDFIDPDRKLILVTAHRRESFDGGLERVFRALRELARRTDVQIVYAVHLNPVVQECARRILGNVSNVHLIAPQDYLPFVCLMDSSHLIITDSGGVQEEGPSLGKPILVTRDTTERPEAVDAGVVKLVGTDFDRIVAEASLLLDDEDAYEAMSRAENPYGDGRAAERIVEALLQVSNQSAVSESLSQAA